jgi:uncharacterized protein (DUF2249 family)
MDFAAEHPLIVFSESAAGVYLLDLREYLLAGGEPLSQIMRCVNQLRPGERLDIHAIFEPVPLIRKLARRGFTLESQHLGLDHWVLKIEPPA